jgi:hypothetical protein
VTTEQRVRDVLPGDDAERAIDALIERRAEEHKRVEASWAQGVARFDARAAAQRRKEWYAFHLDMSALHRNLAAEHEQKAAALLDEGA